MNAGETFWNAEPELIAEVDEQFAQVSHLLCASCRICVTSFQPWALWRDDAALRLAVIRAKLVLLAPNSQLYTCSHVV